MTADQTTDSMQAANAVARHTRLLWHARWVAPLLSALLLSFAFPRFHVYGLAWVALVPLFAVAVLSTPRQAFFQFFLAGWVFHSLLLQWLCANIFWAGGWAIIGQQLLCVFLGLHWAAVGVGWRWITKHMHCFGAVILTLTWFAMEYLMATWFTGFGWSAIGYTQGLSPLAQWASLGRVEYVSIIIVLINALAASVVIRPRWVGPSLAILLLISAYAGGRLMLHPAMDSPAKALKVGVVQPAFSQEIKWDPDFSEIMVNMLDTQSRGLAKLEPVDLLVWPEAAVPGDVDSPKTLRPLQQLTKDTGAALFTGIGRADRQSGKDYNSAALITPEGGVAGLYDKVHLAPFGEYVPLDHWLPFLKSIAFGGVSPGDRQVIIEGAGRRIGPMICFEVLFSPLARKLKQDGAEVLIVITNLAWFGASNAMPQELEIARFRAIETRLPLVHCANTGISGVFDPYGRFLPVHIAVTQEGKAIRYNAQSIEPEQVQQRRLAGAFAVAAPGAPTRMYWAILPFIIALISVLMELKLFKMNTIRKEA